MSPDERGTWIGVGLLWAGAILLPGLAVAGISMTVTLIGGISIMVLGLSILAWSVKSRGR